MGTHRGGLAKHIWNRPGVKVAMGMPPGSLELNENGKDRGQVAMGAST